MIQSLIALRNLICSSVMSRLGLRSRKVLCTKNHFMQKYQVVGLVETHTGHANDPVVHATAGSSGYATASDPAMRFKNSLGNHGGELLLAAKHTYSAPIENSILEAIQIRLDRS